MEPLTPRFEALGRKVAEASDRSADPEHTLAAARTRLLAPQRPHRTSWRYALAAAAVVTAVGAVGFGLGGSRWLAPPAAAPLSFEVGADARAGSVGDWVSAEDERVVVQFSEGSHLSLRPHSRARVVDLTTRGASVIVEQGTLEARITSGAETAWEMRGGPFRVIVTGTAFDLGWEPSSQRFDLAVREGSVRVSGPHVPEDRNIVAGERLTVVVPAGHAELTRGPSVANEAVPNDSGRRAQAPATDPGPGSWREPASGGPSAACQPTPSAVAGGPAATPRPPATHDRKWREYLRAGRAREALAAAEQQGFAGVLAAATNDELWQLVDAARFGGMPARAVEALQALRSRGVRGNTAFFLGKIAADQQGSPQQAIGWFQTYLNESPGGALAEEALGRLMQLQRQSDPAAASAAARRYLARYPKGAYSKLAKSLKNR